MENIKKNVKKEFQLGNVKVELSKEDLENMLKEIDEVKFEEVKYPICCKSKENNQVVLFDELGECTVLRKSEKGVLEVGTKKLALVPHTDKDTWEEIPYDHERGLYHGQWVWCWDDTMAQGVAIQQYDAINECAFYPNGQENGYCWDNYSATCPEHMKEAFTDLLNNEKALGFLKD